MECMANPWFRQNGIMDDPISNFPPKESQTDQERRQLAVRTAPTNRSTPGFRPTFHHFGNGGGAWRAHGIQLEQSMARNAVIGEVFPELREEIRPRLVAMFAAGKDG